MVNQQVLKHHWEEVCDQLQEKWKQLSADDLPSFPGNVDQLIGRIEQKTGASREAIEAYLSELTEESEQAAADMRHRLQAGAEQVADTARQGVRVIREGYAEAGEVIRRRPRQSMAAAFGLGLVAGVGVALLLRSSRPSPPSMYDRAYGRSKAYYDRAYGRGKAYSEKLGQQLRELRDSLAEYASHK